MVSTRKRTARRRDTPRRQLRRNVMQPQAESSFEDAFGHVDPYEAEESIEEHPIAVVDIGNEDINNEDEDETNNTIDNESATGEGDNDHDVGFGNADYFDVNDILELSDTVESSTDIIKDLKDNCISKNSKSTYTCTLVSFILYIYKFGRPLLHKSWIQTINTFSYMIEDEKEKDRIDKKTIKKLLMIGDLKCPPLDIENYTANHFMKYLRSLETKDGK